VHPKFDLVGSLAVSDLENLLMQQRWFDNQEDLIKHRRAAAPPHRARAARDTDRSPVLSRPS
jgi:hypothetical protein